jgi:hypothetical protein
LDKKEQDIQGKNAEKSIIADKLDNKSMVGKNQTRKHWPARQVLIRKGKYIEQQGIWPIASYLA